MVFSFKQPFLFFSTTAESGSEKMNAVSQPSPACFIGKIILFRNTKEPVPVPLRYLTLTSYQKGSGTSIRYFIIFMHRPVQITKVSQPDLVEKKIN